MCGWRRAWDTRISGGIKTKQFKSEFTDCRSYAGVGARGEETKSGGEPFFCRELTGHADAGTAVSFFRRFDSGAICYPPRTSVLPFSCVRACVRGRTRANDT